MHIRHASRPVERRENCIREKFNYLRFFPAFTAELFEGIKCVSEQVKREFLEDPIMLAGKRRSNEEKKRFSLEFRTSLKEEVENFAEEHNVALADVVRLGSEAYVNGYLPVLGSIPCGPWQEVVEQSPYFELAPPFLKPRKGDFLLEASGDSMSPKIETGDYVLLRPGIEASNGEVCAVQIRGEDDSVARATLKKVFVDYQTKTHTLKPINPNFPEETLPFGQIEIIAVARGLIKKNGIS
jgi:SOS-response transcriptional repressor LexA